MLLRNFTGLLNVLFPAECACCRAALSSSENILCQGCFSSLSGLKLGLSGLWRETPVASVRNTWSALRYEGGLKPMMRRVKFKREFYLLNPLGKMAFDAFDAITASSRYDFLIPVPSGLRRRLERRFNPSEIIASQLAERSGIPVLKNALTRRIHSRPQSSVTRSERRWNVFGAFQARENANIHGRNLLLIDDILTTGATAGEAARALKEAGAKSVDVFTLARTGVSRNERAA